nr:site-specific integrase [Acidisphaera sp. L21]
MPANILARVGRTELVRTLRTGRPLVAQLLAVTIAMRLYTLWETLKLTELDSAVAAKIEAWFKAEVDRAWRLYSTGEHAGALIPDDSSREDRHRLQRAYLADDAEHRIASLVEQHAAGDYIEGRVIARDIISSLPGAFDEHDQRFTALSKRILEALAEIEEARLRWAAGDDGYVPLLDVGQAAAPTPAKVRGAGTILKEIAEEYVAHRLAERGTSAKDAGQLRGQITTLLEQVGSATTVEEFTPRLAGEVFTAFRSLPPNFRKHTSLRGLTLFDAAKRARLDKLQPMTAKSVNNYMTTYRGVFKEAIDQGLVFSNPFQGKHVLVTESVQSERGFKADELSAILKSPVFNGCERTGRPFQPGSFLLNDRRFWLPLVAMLTGARVSELCQLRSKDVKQLDGVWLISINLEAGKTLKTPQSVREVPIHDQLLRLGFLEYTRNHAADAPGSLFDIPTPNNGDWGAKMGKWLREKFLPGVLSTSTRDGLGFHSFRHNFETEMRAANLRTDVGHRMLGHKPPDVAGRYGRYEPATAAANLKLIRFPSDIEAIPARP